MIIENVLNLFLHFIKQSLATYFLFYIQSQSFHQIKIFESMIEIMNLDQ